MDKKHIQIIKVGKRYIRYKYAAKDKSVVITAQLPDWTIDKENLEANLQATILIAKYMDHIPLYRHKQIFARENIKIPSPAIECWTRQALKKLQSLCERLIFDSKKQGCFQGDEIIYSPTPKGG